MECVKELQRGAGSLEFLVPVRVGSQLQFPAWLLKGPRGQPFCLCPCLEPWQEEAEGKLRRHAWLRAMGKGGDKAILFPALSCKDLTLLLHKLDFLHLEKTILVPYLMMLPMLGCTGPEQPRVLSIVPATLESTTLVPVAWRPPRPGWRDLASLQLLIEWFLFHIHQRGCKI